MSEFEPVLLELEMDIDFLRILSEDDQPDFVETFLAMMSYLVKLFASSPDHRKVILGHMKSELAVYTQSLFDTEAEYNELMVMNTSSFYDGLTLLAKLV